MRVISPKLYNVEYGAKSLGKEFSFSIGSEAVEELAWKESGSKEEKIDFTLRQSSRKIRKKRNRKIGKFYTE